MPGIWISVNRMEMLELRPSAGYARRNCAGAGADGGARRRAGPRPGRILAAPRDIGRRPRRRRTGRRSLRQERKAAAQLHRGGGLVPPRRRGRAYRCSSRACVIVSDRRRGGGGSRRAARWLRVSGEAGDPASQVDLANLVRSNAHPRLKYRDRECFAFNGGSPPMRGDAEPTKSVWQNRPLANCRRNSIVRLCFRKILNENPQMVGHSIRGTVAAPQQRRSGTLRRFSSDKTNYPR
jgi:hypothetical protein